MENLTFFRTEDGSPTLSTTYQSGVTEKMHHFRGAFSESIYIYEPAIAVALVSCPDETVQICSLGLGLGYNEIIAAGVSISTKRTPKKLVTYEIDNLLVAQLKLFLAGQLSGTWAEAYTDIFRRTADHFKIDEALLLTTLQEWVQSSLWQIRGAFPEFLPPDEKYHSILYDAFSTKMDSPLWDEGFLVAFIKNHSFSSCAFSTYAATGALKRALKANEFTLHKKQGFGGKKESTFALREFSQNLKSPPEQ